MRWTCFNIYKRDIKNKKILKTVGIKTLKVIKVTLVDQIRTGDTIEKLTVDEVVTW